MTEPQAPAVQIDPLAELRFVGAENAMLRNRALLLGHNEVLMERAIAALTQQATAQAAEIEKLNTVLADRDTAMAELAGRHEADRARLHRTVRQMAVEHGQLKGNPVVLADQDPDAARSQHVHDLTARIAELEAELEQRAGKAPVTIDGVASDRTAA